MSLEFIQHPPVISFVKNPINYSVQTNKLYETPFVYPSIILTFAAKIPKDNLFSFDFIDPVTKQNSQILINFVPVPDGKGREVVDDAFAGSVGLYLIEVINELQKNVELKSFYIIELDGGTGIKLTAKEAIADLIPTNFVSTNGSLTAVISSDFLKPDRENIFIVTELWIIDKDNPELHRKVLESSVAPDDNGNVDIDVSQALNAELINVLLDPPVRLDINSASLTKDNLLIEYYIRVAESFGGEIGEWKYDRCIRLGRCGGVSLEDFPKIDPFLFIALKKRFMSWYPNNKTLHVDQPDWLNWINYTNAPINVKVVHKAYYKDGTDSGDQISAGTVVLDPWESFTLPVGYTQLDIGTLNPAKEVYKWTIKIINDPAAITVSEERTFFLDCRFYECSNLIVYLNSMCAAESFLTKGEWLKNLDVDRSFSDRALNHDYKIINGQEYQFDRTAKNSFEARSGYVKKEDAEALQDILINSNSFLIENDEYIPINIQSKSFKITECNQFLHSFSFKVNKSLLINEISKIDRKPIITPQLDCGIVGFNIDDNNTEPSAWGNLSIYDSQGGLIYNVPATPMTSPFWVFPATIEKEDEYKITVQITLTGGEVLDYDFNYRLVNKHAIYKTTKTGFHFIQLRDTLAENSYIDMRDGNGEILKALVVGLNVLSTAYPSAIVKEVDFNIPCIENIDQILVLNQNIEEIEIGEFRNVKNIIINGNNIPEKLNVSEFINLENFNYFNNNSDDVVFGYHPNIQNINLGTNNISNDNLDDIIFHLWGFRKRYIFVGIVLNVSLNPDLPLSAYALSIINGTGDFLNEGLVPNYSWIVIS